MSVGFHTFNETDLKIHWEALKMLLFSALLEINDSMTKDAFVKLVIEWNQGSPYHENRISGIQWSGEYNIRYGTDTLWMGIEEYRNQNIIAVRYEKIDKRWCRLGYGLCYEFQ